MKTKASFARKWPLEIKRGNVVVPDAYFEQWGADTFRMSSRTEA
jgi:hypothetical protein